MDRDFQDGNSSRWSLCRSSSVPSPGLRRERGRSGGPQEGVQGSRREGGAGPEALKKKGFWKSFCFFFSPPK